MTLRRQRAQSLQSTLTRAIQLGQYAVFYNNANLINEIEDKYSRVTKEDLQRVAKTYLTEANRSVVITVPKPKSTTATSGSGN
jgi:zinc protease